MLHCRNRQRDEVDAVARGGGRQRLGSGGQLCRELWRELCRASGGWDESGWGMATRKRKRWGVNLDVNATGYVIHCPRRPPSCGRGVLAACRRPSLLARAKARCASETGARTFLSVFVHGLETRAPSLLHPFARRPGAMRLRGGAQPSRQAATRPSAAKGASVNRGTDIPVRVRPRVGKPVPLCPFTPSPAETAVLWTRRPRRVSPPPPTRPRQGAGE
jgi:hypothetical protein